jgi:hypothetical protein
MKNLLYFLLLTSTLGVSQITFEKGYFINSNNEKINCFIKNLDWVNSPTHIYYKVTEDGETLKIEADSLFEFGIGTKIKFIKKQIVIDDIENKANKFNLHKTYKVRNQTSFLKVLIEGEANLYKYESNTQFKYYFSKSNDSIIPLIYYQYVQDGILQNGQKIRTVEPFKKMLYENLSCNNLEITDFLKLKYQEKPLKDIFLKFNMCHNSPFTEYRTFDNKAKWVFTPRIGLMNNTIDIAFQNNKSINYPKTDYTENITNPSLSLEIEYLMPFNKNKFSLVLEPTYDYYNFKHTQKDAFSSIVITDNMQYSSIKLPLTIRYNFFLSTNNRIYINAGYNYDLTLKAEFTKIIETQNSTTNFESTFQNYGCFTVGTGIKIKDLSLNFNLFAKSEKFFKGNNISTFIPDNDKTIVVNAFRISLGYSL